jgi:hypothetical protein
MNKNLTGVNGDVSLFLVNYRVKSKVLTKNIRNEGEIIYAKPIVIASVNQNKISATAINNVFCS